MRQLETKRLILRPWEDGDAPVLYRWASDPEVGPRAGWPPHTSQANSLEIIHGALSLPETYAMVLKETGEPVGSIGLFTPDVPCPDLPVPEGMAQMELGYWVARPYWGRGLAPEASAALLDRGFGALNCAVIQCCHFDFNQQSKRVIEKLGFTCFATEDAADGAGNPCTNIRYALSRERWEKRRLEGRR